MKRIWAIFFALFLLPFGVATSHAILYFPHFDTTTNAWQTEICVINLSATGNLDGDLKIYSQTGTLLNSQHISVLPKSRRQFNVGADLQGASNTKGYIVFQNSSASAVGYTKFTQVNGERVAIPAVDGTSTGNIYVTHIAWAPWWTGISLVNTTSEDKTLTIRFNNGQTKTLTLPANQQYVNMIAALLNNLIDTTIESAVIENASGIVGLELFGNGSQLGGVPLTSKTTTTLFYPHLESAGGWWTGIVAYNPSTTATAQVTVNPYDANGNPLNSSTRSIEPGQKFVGYPTDLNLPPAAAWFSLRSSIPLVGFELFGYDPNRLAGYSVVDLEGKSGIFPKVEKDGWTGIAFVNTENEQATVTLKAYTNTGTVVATGTKTLGAHAKWVGLPTDPTLFPPGTNLSSATYLSYSADRNVAGFQLNNSTSNTMLDALPGASPSGQKIVDKALGFLQYQDTATSGMTAVTDILGQILGTSSGSTCPQVTVNPDPATINLSALPSAITITASYGNGCTPSGSTAVTSGQVVLAITNLSVNSDFTSISLDYSLTSTNLTQGGVVLLNGSVSGHIAFAGSQLNASANFNNFQVADSTISGSMAIAATNLNLSGSTVDVGDMTITLNNLTAAGYTVTSGTVTLSSAAGSMTGQLTANLNTSQGSVNISMTSERLGSTGYAYTFSTTVPGTIAGYTVTMTNVTMDTTCANNPIAGSVTVSQGGSSFTQNFTATCVPIAGSVIALQDGPSVDRTFAATHMPIAGWVATLQAIKRYVTPAQ